ncbi:MAG: hypothetical protein AB8B87_14360 [Granulosicoccus sp.]
MKESYKKAVHACFRLDIKFPITVENEGDLLELWQSLSYRIMRQPTDLLTHTRRIRLCQEPVLNDRLDGALADLEYVLEGRGTALLVRLRSESLRAAKNYPGQYEPQSGHHGDTAPARGRVLPTLSQLLQMHETTSAPTFLS